MKIQTIYKLAFYYTKLKTRIIPNHI